MSRAGQKLNLFGSKERRHFDAVQLATDLPVPTLYKLYEQCMWKVLDKELRPLPDQLFGIRPGRQCLDIVSFLVERLLRNEEWGRKTVRHFYGCGECVRFGQGRNLGRRLRR